MKSLAPTLRGTLPAIFALGAALLLPTTLRAADHADAPALAQDQAADIADAYFFLDPNDNTQVVIIGTVHGFIVPGEAANVAIFDPNVRFRFEIFNQHVNATLPVLPPNATPAQKAVYARAKAAFLARVKVNKTIDVTFSKVAVPPQPTDPDVRDQKYQLKKPGPQSAVITLTGFKDAANRGVIKKASDGTDILTTQASLAAAADTRTINTLSLNSTTPGTIKFFAGEVDDPFFFDVVGFSRTIKALHDGTANPTSNLSRARDTFAGYNILAIAITMPKSLLVDPSGPMVGLDFLTQRQTLQLVTNDGIVGRGGYKTVDRIGNPAINTALIPFNKKNAYNASNVKADAAGTFLPDIAATITQLGLGTNDAHIGALANVAVSFGDVLKLNTDSSVAPNGTDTASRAGGGSGPNGFPNGRRLKDDTIDFILTQLANGATTGDGVDANDVPLLDTFPFLQVPHQPLAYPNTDDGTRN